jgi:hypothetical protein
MLSILELRHLIEGGFQPFSCTCTSNHDGSLMIKVFEADTGRVELLVTAITMAELTSHQSIAKLIGELRSEMALRNTLYDVDKQQSMKSP